MSGKGFWFGLSVLIVAILFLGTVIFHFKDYSVSAQALDPAIPIDISIESEGWQASGIWNKAEDTWNYNQGSEPNYDTGEANSGELITPVQSFELSQNYSAYFSFSSKLDTELSPFYDIAAVSVRVDGSDWQVLEGNVPDSDDFLRKEYDVTQFLGTGKRQVEFKLSFETKDHYLNSFEGWRAKDFLVELVPTDKSQILKPALGLTTSNPHKDTNPRFDVTIEHTNLLEKMEVMVDDKVLGQAEFQSMAGMLCFEDGNCSPAITFAEFEWDSESGVSPEPGMYEVYLRVADKMGQVSKSEPVKVEIFGEGGDNIITLTLEEKKYEVDNPIELLAQMEAKVAVEKVEFYAGDQLIGQHEAVLMPDCLPETDCMGLFEVYVLQWTKESVLPLSVGVHEVYALAKAKDGESYKSNTINVEVVADLELELGDCDGNGEVNYMDLAALDLEIGDGDGQSVDDVAGGSFEGTKACDVNEDKKINNQDKVALEQIVGAGGQCTDDYSPVCGTDGETYSNSCVLFNQAPEGVIIAHEGECVTKVDMDEINLTETELGECTSQNLGTIKYSQDTFYGCKTSGWVKLDI